MASPAAFPGFEAPAVGFEQPFEMLEACHDRVQRSLDLLRRLREYLRSNACDETARQAARDVLRYFDIAAPLHHQDEELHIFPPLLARGTAETAALVRQLQRDHVRMADEWAAARVPLQRLARGDLQSLTAAHEALLDRFVARHAEHLRREESGAYPEARRLLEYVALEPMGREMARRRAGGGRPSLID